MYVRTMAAAAAAVTLGAMAAPAHAFNPPAGAAGLRHRQRHSDQTIRLNIVSWEHDVGGMPPAPCSGELMFHDMAGNIVARQIVRLRPGSATVPDYSLGARTSPATLVDIEPCWIPDPLGGRTLPTVEVFTARAAGSRATLTP